MRKLILLAFVLWGAFTIFIEENHSENILVFDYSRCTEDYVRNINFTVDDIHPSLATQLVVEASIPNHQYDTLTTAEAECLSKVLIQHAYNLHPDSEIIEEVSARLWALDRYDYYTTAKSVTTYNLLTNEIDTMFFR